MNRSELEAFAGDCGADLFGIADLDRIRGIRTQPPDLLEPFTRGISMAVRLSDGIIDPIEDRPTPLYQQHYLRCIDLQDKIALRVSQRLQASGAKALPVPSSVILDRESWSSFLSHRAVALAAGIGWQGKSLMVVSPRYGPRIRLITVLTDMPLEPDAPLENRCGSCTSCSDACPAGAIKNVNTTTHYATRNEALHFDRCVERVTEIHTKLPFIERPICGVCIRACPWGAPKKG